MPFPPPTRINSVTAAARPSPQETSRRSIGQQFIVFLLPLLLGNVLQALSNTINGIFLGRMLGASAIASAASVFPVLMFFTAFVIGLGTGASILVGRAWGAKDLAKAQQIAGAALVGSVSLGLVAALVGIVSVDGWLQWMHTPPEIHRAATAYARITVLAFPAVFAFMLASAVLRGTGDTRTPLISLAIACVALIVLTPTLIGGAMGMPRLGVEGAALAGACATLLSLAWLMLYLAKRHSPFAFGSIAPHLRFNRAILFEIVRLGVPTGLFFVTGSLADMMLLSLVNSYGATATAAWGAVSQVMAYVQMPAMCIAIAASVFTAQAIGAKELFRLSQITNTGIWMNLALTGGVATLAALFSSTAVRLFVVEPEVVQLAGSLLHITVWGSVLFGIASVFSGVMRAAGTVLIPTTISLACLAVLLVPLASVFNGILGIHGLWLAYPATYGCALLLQALYFYRIWRLK